jgi:hypothetical protein
MSATRSAHSGKTSQSGATFPDGTSWKAHQALSFVSVIAHARRGVKLHIAGCVLVAALVAACGSVPSASTTPAPPGSGSNLHSPLASPSVNPSANLFAVVETGPNQDQPGTVTIIDRDGSVEATATFQPRVGPRVPDAYTPLQSVAQVVGTGVYYIDGAGTVRVLRVGSQPQVVARFPLQAAQEDVWFAVSPDGSQVVAGILTLPALGPNYPGTGWPTLVGPWKFDLEMASADGQTITLVHTESAYEPDDRSHHWKPMFPVGWIEAGPVVMLPDHVTSQNAWWGGPLYLIDSSGKTTTRVGGSDCMAADVNAKGLIACKTSANSVQVRDASGQALWTTHVSGDFAMMLFLSADGLGISSGLQVETMAGGMAHISGGLFVTGGWLDSGTVAGHVQYTDHQGNLSWVSLADPTVVHDLGFEGDLVAAIA